MDAAEAISREQIRDLLSRYNHAGDRGDLDRLVACFAEDGVLDLEDEPELRGREAIHRHLSGVVRRLAERSERVMLRHHVSSVWIEVDGSERARADSLFLAFTEVGLDHWGRYRDRLERSGDQWRFAHRRVRVDGASPGSRMVELAPDDPRAGATRR